MGTQKTRILPPLRVRKIKTYRHSTKQLKYAKNKAIWCIWEVAQMNIVDTWAIIWL